MIGTLKNIRPDPFRSPLQDRQPFSYPCPRDLPPSVEFDIPAPSTSRFPMSSIRPDEPQNTSAMPPVHPPEPVYPRHDPLHILSPTTPPPPPRSYPTVLPAPSVAPGILADGVLTAKLPSVKKFLQAAAIAPPDCPPLPTDTRVLALVALSVFYHPLHPAHWAFWNKEQKKATAAMIQSVLDTTPTPILSPIGWIDIPENLWILKSMQAAYSSVLTEKPWYATYTPAEPESRMNLRKRRAPAIPTSHRADGDETMDEEERLTPPPRKRAKTRRSAANRSSGAKSRGEANNDVMEDEAMQVDGPAALETVASALLLTPDHSVSAPALTRTAKHDVIESLGIVLTVSPADDESVQPEPPDVEEEVPELRKSLRQLERKAKVAGSASPASVASTLTPPVRARGLSLTDTPSRESSSVTSECVGGADSGSSTAVSLCDEEGTKTKSTKTVEEVLDEEEEEEEEEEEGEEDAEPVAKKARTARSRAKSGSRARTVTRNKAENVAEEAKTNTTAQARPKARSRAKARRR